MAKIQKKPDTLLFPLPVVLVSCRDSKNSDNLITIAWTGIICSDPPALSISIRPNRYSYGIIKESGVFGVNIPSRALAKKVDYCGVVSGGKVDKFKRCGFGKFEAVEINAALVQECPINLECKVINSVELGTHEVFMAKILKTWVSEEVLGPGGRVDPVKVDAYSYCDGKYMSSGEVLGTYGYSKK